MRAQQSTRRLCNFRFFSSAAPVSALCSTKISLLPGLRRPRPSKRATLGSSSRSNSCKGPAGVVNVSPGDARLGVGRCEVAPAVGGAEVSQICRVLIVASA